MSTIDYGDKIPNNVNLSEDRTLQRALEHWQPGFLDWWKDMGPDDSRNFDVYLRTAISVDPSGWAQFGYVKMPDYRWGIFLEPNKEEPTIKCGDDAGAPASGVFAGKDRHFHPAAAQQHGAEQAHRSGTQHHCPHPAEHLRLVRVGQPGQTTADRHELPKALLGDGERLDQHAHLTQLRRKAMEK